MLKLHIPQPFFFFADFPTNNKEETENWQINPFKVGEQGRQGEAKTFFLRPACLPALQNDINGSKNSQVK